MDRQQEEQAERRSAYCPAPWPVFTRASGPDCLCISPSVFSIPSMNVCAYIMLPFSPFPAWVPVVHIARDGEEEEVAWLSLLDWHPIGGQTPSAHLVLLRMAPAEIRDGDTLITISQTR